MLKKSASSVLASFRPSTGRTRFSEAGNSGGGFPFAKIHNKGERPTRSAVCTSSALHSLRPCWTNFLSILRVRVLLTQTCGPLDFRHVGLAFPQTVSRRNESMPQEPAQDWQPVGRYWLWQPSPQCTSHEWPQV